MYYQLTTEIQDLGIAKISKCEDDIKAIIQDWNIDVSLKRLLQWYWFEDSIEVGPTIFSIQDMIRTEKEWGSLKNDLLVIGCGPNGDYLLTNVKTLEILYWNHEEAEDDENLLQNDCIKLYDHILELLLNIRNRNYIPWDSYATEDYKKAIK